MTMGFASGDGSGENGDTERSAMLLGPAASGKTYAALGLLLTLTDSDAYDVEAIGDDVADFLTEYEETLPDRPDDDGRPGVWGLAGTPPDDAPDFELTCRVPETPAPLPGALTSFLPEPLLTTRVTVRIADSPGRRLQDLSRRFEDGPTGRRVDDSAGGETNPIGTALDDLVVCIEETDTLVLSIDAGRFLGYEPLSNDPEMMLSEMQTVAAHADDVVLAATKADYLIDPWTEAYSRSFEPHENHEQFSRDVTDLLTNQNPVIESLVQTTHSDTIYPVYFRTEAVDGARRPLLDEQNRLQPEGYDRLLDAVVEG